MTNSE